MPGEYLLDTSVIVPFFRGDRPVRERLAAADRVFLSAVVFGELCFGAEGRSSPRPIPENDLWIAATAIQHPLVLASRDDHFTEVEGLTGERW